MRRRLHEYKQALGDIQNLSWQQKLPYQLLSMGGGAVGGYFFGANIVATASAGLLQYWVPVAGFTTLGAGAVATLNWTIGNIILGQVRIAQQRESDNAMPRTNDPRLNMLIPLAQGKEDAPKFKTSEELIKYVASEKFYGGVLASLTYTEEGRKQILDTVHMVQERRNPSVHSRMVATIEALTKNGMPADVTHHILKKIPEFEADSHKNGIKKATAMVQTKMRGQEPLAGLPVEQEAQGRDEAGKGKSRLPLSEERVPLIARAPSPSYNHAATIAAAKAQDHAASLV